MTTRRSPRTRCSPTGTATGEETAPRTLARGGAAVSAALASGALGPGRPEVLVSVAGGSDRLLEGRLVGPAGEPLATLAASLQLDGAGAVVRALVCRTPYIEPSPTWATANGAVPDARSVLDAYFEHLAAGRFEAAADCFSEDCLYSHPPYRPGAGRVEFRGRDALLAGFVVRGQRPHQHQIAVTLQRGAECLLEGTVTGTALGGSFVSSLSLDAGGRIRRYAAFYCEPPVERR